jgi:hypothetical protein
MTGEEKNNEQKGKEILFTYEHLPDFCYICGVIGHNDRGCPNKQNLGVGHEFGSWLRAEDWEGVQVRRIGAGTLEINGVLERIVLEATGVAMQLRGGRIHMMVKEWGSQVRGRKRKQPAH